MHKNQYSYTDENGYSHTVYSDNGSDFYNSDGKLRFLHNLVNYGHNYSMIKPETTIAAIKRNIENCYSKPVSVKLNLGRNKFVSFDASVSGIYPSIFTVEPTDKNFLGKTTYSYAEILCGKVFITLSRAVPQQNPPKI